MPFSKGKSGNPAGRARGTKTAGGVLTQDIRDYAKQYSQEAIDGLAKIAREATEHPNAQVKAWEVLLDRAHGKAHQAVDVTAKGVTVNLGFLQLPAAIEQPKKLSEPTVDAQILETKAAVSLGELDKTK